MKALMVDLDGTLVDSEEANAAAYVMALSEVGVEISVQDFIALSAGKNWRQFLPPILAAAGSSADMERIASRKRALYATMIPRLEVNGALVALVDACRPGSQTVLVTNASKAATAAILDHFSLRGLFDLIVTGDDVTEHKPSPIPYAFAASRLGVAPADCVVVEDSETGIASARAFGAAVLQVAWA
jgi:beta-phosphoglucomutase